MPTSTRGVWKVLSIMYKKHRCMVKSMMFWKYNHFDGFLPDFEFFARVLFFLLIFEQAKFRDSRIGAMTSSAPTKWRPANIFYARGGQLEVFLTQSWQVNWMRKKLNPQSWIVATATTVFWVHGGWWPGSRLDPSCKNLRETQVLW